MLFNEGAFISIDQERCLNHHHNNVGCNHCVSLCPGEALKVFENKVSLNRDKCLGCGLCFSNCPTEVFHAKPYDETAIIKDVDNRGASVTQFFCEYNKSPFLKKDEQDKGAIQIPTCLGSISKGAWYELGLHTKVELRLENCNECPMGKCVERLQYTINTAIEWLSASGYTPDFTSIYSVGEVQQKKRFKAVSTGMKVTSRRDLFLSLFNMGKNTIEKVREQDYSSNGRTKRGTESLLPRWQQRLGKSYSEHFREGGSPAYWPSVEKRSTCVNCGLCAKNCPTHALQIKVEGERAVHVFTSGHCLDCRMCQLFCPTGSIIRDRHLCSSPFEPQVVHEVPVIKCKQCGKSTAGNDEHLCYWCKNEPQENEVLADVWNHIFARNG